MRFLGLFVASISIVFGNGCRNADSSSQAVRDSEADNFFVKGDPLLNIKDTELNSKSFFTPNQMSKFNGFEMSFSGMTERVPKSEYTASVEQAKKQQIEQSKATLEHKPLFYRMDKKKDSDGNTFWFYHPVKELNSYNFHFYPSEKNPNELVLKGWSWKDGDPVEIDVLHYSLKKDGSAFSVLFATDNEEYKSTLVEFLFMRPNLQNPGSPLSPADSKYKFIHSSKIRVAWPQNEPLTFALCGPIGSNFQSPVTDAVEHWKSALEGRLDVKLAIARKKCPPFSDLNFHGIYFVDNYNADYGMATYVQGSPAAKKIFDADILVNIGNYKKYWASAGFKLDGPRVKESFNIYSAMTHEIGHALGLDHKFDSTAVMSYEAERRFSFYDKAAIQTLYPLLSKLPQNQKPATLKSKLKNWIDEKLGDSE